jgi:hypothetical protein
VGGKITRVGLSGYERAPIVMSAPSASAVSSWLSFHYADELIQVERGQKAREVSRILIKVDPDCRVRVSAPDGASDEQVGRAEATRALDLSATS